MNEEILSTEEIEVLFSESDSDALSDPAELEVDSFSYLNDTEVSVLVADDVQGTSSDINYQQITCFLILFLVVFTVLTRLEK